MANWVYYENYQIPIFTVGIVLLWTVVIIRFWIFKQTFCGWRSYRGAATILITATAALCTIYFGVMLAIYFVNQAMLKVRKLPREGEKMGTNPKFPWRDPINYSDAEVKEYIQHVCLLIRLIYANRILLTIGLYLIKFSFSVLFLETQSALILLWRRFLQLTILGIIAALLLSIWGIGKDMSNQLPQLAPTPQRIRNGTSYRGARFILFDFDVELILTISNIITDLCLVAIAFKTVRSFRRPLTAVLFPCLLIGLCVAVALARLGLVIVTKSAPLYTSYATIPFELFAELETFVAVVVACIPGLRVAVRRREERDERRKSGAGVARNGGGGEVRVEMASVGVENWEVGRWRRDRDLEARGALGQSEGSLEIESPRGSVFKPVVMSGENGLLGRERIRSDGQVFLSGEEFLK